MKFATRLFLFSFLSFFLSVAASAQTSDPELARLVAAPGVPGYENVKGAVGEVVRASIKALSPAPKVAEDSMGNLLVTFEGTGSGPKRLIVAPLDEPGYVVSGITPDGFLRLQRLPQQSPQGLFDALHFAQPVSVIGRDGRRVPGVIGGLSVHLQPARRDAPKMDHLDDMYVDIGATSDAEARRAGADVLDPVFVERRLFSLANGLQAGTGIGDRYGAAALLALARRISDGKFTGSVTLAFVTQQWAGGRGLARLLTSTAADEMVYIGRLPAARGQAAGAAQTRPGSGVLLGTADPSQPLGGYAAEIQSAARDAGTPLTIVAAGPLRPPAAPGPKLPERFVQLALPLEWAVTPIEMISESDLENMGKLLERAVRGQVVPRDALGGGVADGHFAPSPHKQLPVEEVLKRLSETYGASGHEAAVREEVLKLLPEWAKPETDASGNLILQFKNVPPPAAAGAKKREPPAPLVFVAHMDELGFEVKAIGDDGRLQVESLGGGQAQYYFGHPMLLHGEKATLDGVLELPVGWDTPQFTWPPTRGEARARVDVGARSRAEAEALGIKVGDWLTIPKSYRKLYGARANARSFDDRVGCTALVAAVWALGQTLPNRDVTFIWSTEEEVGLRGAGAAAERLNAAGRTPQTVFAIDTFVSSDSPLEGKRFADAPIGKGFVVRAVDNSNIVPRALADRVVSIARQHKIAVQYGVTGGGNDGSTFTRYGTVDVAMGWPLRYSHSAAEVIDTRDVQALADIVTALAREW